MLTFIVNLLLILLPIPQTEFATSEWKRVTTEQGISFLFPSYPQHKQQMTGNFHSDVYQTKDIACVYGVVASDFSNQPEFFAPENIQSFYDQMLKGSLEVPTAILKDERSVEFDGILIKEIEYSVIDGKYEMTYFKRFIFRAPYIYQISIGGRSRHRDFLLQNREIFFSSISFPEKENEKNKICL